MSGYFYCRHCGKLMHKNPRIKTQQYYCGCQRCQQARKNQWERQKLKNSPRYHDKRKDQKAHWRNCHSGHQYQKEYRQAHPSYVETNRELQLLRNKKAVKIVLDSNIQKIVKADALISEILIGRDLHKILLVVIRPGEKIVKTDALISEILSHRGFQEILVTKTE